MIEYTLEKQDFSSNNIPQLILKQYDALYSMLDNKQYYGVLFKVKDVLEIALKFPEIVLIAGMEQYIMREDVEADTVTNKKAFKVMEMVLSYKLSLGHFEDISDILVDCSIEDLPLDAQDKLLYKTYLDVISNISAEYKYPDKTLINARVSNWRNDYIGHGALNTNEEELKNVVEPLIKILNKVLSLSDYSNVEHIFSKSELLIRNRKDNLISIRIDPFVDYFDYVFDSYEWDRDRVRVLNYNKGDKKKNSVLSERFAKLRKKVKFTQPSSNALESDVITHQDEQSVVITLDGKVKMITPFFEATQNLLAEEKGILLLRAGRGMGKSTFADSIVVDDIFERRSTTGSLYNKLKQQDGPDISVWVYHFNEFWKSDRNTFKNALNFSHKFVKHENLQNAFDNLPRGFKCKGEEEAKEFKKNFAAYLEVLLKTVREVKRKCKLLLVLDGIDEIPLGKEKVKVSEFLDRDLLPEGVYILLLGRPEEEWILPNDIKNMYLEERVIKHSGAYKTCLLEYANGILNSIANKVKDQDKTAVKNISSQQIVEKADCRMLYLSIINSISKLNPIAFVNIFNTDHKGELINSYLSAFDTVSVAYKNQILRVLLILSLSRFGLTMSELYYLFEGSLIAEPNFKFWGILNDLRGFIKSERSSKGNLFSLANEELYHELEGDDYSEFRDEILKSFKDNLDCDIDSELLTKREIIMVNIYKEYEDLNINQKLSVLDSLWKMQGEFSKLDETTKAEYKELLTKISEESELEDNEMFIRAKYLLLVLDGVENYWGLDENDLFLRFKAYPDLIQKFPMEFLKLMQANSHFNTAVGNFEINRNVANLYYILLKEQLVSETYDIFEKIYLPMYKKAIDYGIKDFYFLKDLYFYDEFEQLLSGIDLAKFYIYRAYMFRYFGYKPEISTSVKEIEGNFKQDVFDSNQFFNDLEKGLEHLKNESNVDEIYLLVSKVIKSHYDYISSQNSLENILAQFDLYENLYEMAMSHVSSQTFDELVEDRYSMKLNYFYYISSVDLAEKDSYLNSCLDWMKRFYHDNHDKIDESKLYCERSILIAEYIMLKKANNMSGINKLLEGKIEALCKDDNYAYKFGMTKFGAFLPCICAEKIKLDLEKGNLNKLSGYLNVMSEGLSAISVFPQEIDVLILHDACKKIFEIIGNGNLDYHLTRNIYTNMVPAMPKLFDYVNKHKEQCRESLVLLYLVKLYVLNAEVMEKLREFDKSYNNYCCAKTLFDCSTLIDHDLYEELVVSIYEYYSKMSMEEDVSSLRKKYNRITSENSEYDPYCMDCNDDYYDPDEMYEPQVPCDYFDPKEFDSKYSEFDSYQSLDYSINVYKIFKSFKNSNVDHFLFNRTVDKFGRRFTGSYEFFYIDIADFLFDAKLIEDAEECYSDAVCKFEEKNYGKFLCKLEGQELRKLKLAYALSKRAAFYMYNDRKEDAKKDFARVQIIAGEFELDLTKPMALKRVILKRKVQKSIEDRERFRQKLNELKINENGFEYEITLDDDE